MKSHTGGLIFFRRGMLHFQSGKKTLNTNISTEAEIVGVSDYVLYNIHFIMFL